MKKFFTNLVAVDDVNISRRDIFVENGLITKEFEKDEETEIIDCNGLVLVPSFVDMHTHFRDPGFTYKEDLKTGSMAALKGGYTTVNLMPNTNPIVSSKDVYQDIIQRGQDLDLIDIKQVYSITKDFKTDDLSHLNDLPEGLLFLSNDGKGVDDDFSMYQAIKIAKENNLKFTLHEECKEISKYDYEIAEDLMTLRDAYLAYKMDVPIHFSHVSTKGAIEAIRFFKDLGANITCEVTPHHIYFSDRDDLKVNPPIRKEKDKNALLDMIKKGYVDCIATDHAPHTKKEKEEGKPGFIGLETAFSTSYMTLVKTGIISLNDLIRLMSTNPSKLLEIKKGKIEEGYMADFTLIDLDKIYEYKEEDILSKSKNSLFLNQKLQGEIVRVYKKGILKYDLNGKTL
ncbi:dihydroorotase [Anaerococcus jeddahensis]|uniref:dihydroorotase n=1 Tax=Anaerococcus jeddahensis TaxID=1673719 RepID=UPI0006723AF8|nr:dihydroorotase [Anaerococcus jeddahensis]